MKFYMNDIFHADLKKWLKVAYIILILAVVPVWPYGFYTLLRLLICGLSAYAAYRFSKHKDLMKHKIPLIVIAALFNPFFPVYLFRIYWIPIDLGCAYYFYYLRTILTEDSPDLEYEVSLE